MINQISAFSETLEFARQRGMHQQIGTSDRGLDYAHLDQMYRKIISDPTKYSDAKLGRWLGWAQAAVVAAGCGTLDDMKEINRKNCDE